MIQDTTLWKTGHLSEKIAYNCELAEEPLLAKLSQHYAQKIVTELETLNDEKTRAGMLGDILSQKIILEIEKGNILSNAQVVQLTQVLGVREPWAHHIYGRKMMKEWETIYTLGN